MELSWRKLDQKLIEEINVEDAKVKNRLVKLSKASISNKDNKVSDFKVYQYQLRNKANSSISISPFFKGDGNYENFKYRYFAGGFSDNNRITDGKGAKIEIERFGLGISLELEITDIKSSIKGGFGVIAAAVEMQLANAQYSYTIHALPEGEFYHLLPPIGKFDFNSFEKFHNLVKRLKELYRDALKSKINLVAIEVLLSQAVEEEGLENSRAYFFAAKQIIKESSLERAIKEARKAKEVLNEDAIQYIYAICGLDSIEQIPISGNISRARKIIFA